MARLQAVGAAPVHHHHLVGSGIDCRAAIDRNDLRHRARRRWVRHQRVHARWRTHQQPVARADFFFGVGDQNGRWHHALHVFALLLHRLAAFAAQEHGAADELRLKAQHRAGGRVFQGLGVAKHAKALFALVGELQRRAQRAAGIGAVALRQQHAAFLRRHNARRGQHGGLVNHHGFDQEGLNQIALDGAGQRLGQGRAALLR